MILELSNLVVTYGAGRQTLTAVDHLSLAVGARQTVGLAGESGSGKSTVAKAIAGLVPIAGGSLTVDGVECTSEKRRNTSSYRRRIQMVFQEPHASLNPRMSVGGTLCEALALRDDISRSQRRGEALQALARVGLAVAAFDRYPHEFSGGQLQRVAIARALVVRPELIVMDEVTSALDVSVQARILNLLRDLQVDYGMSYLFISHDLSVIRFMSDAVGIMYLGELIELGPTESLFSNPGHPYTRGLLASIPTLSLTTASTTLRGEIPDPYNVPTGCRFNTRCPIGPFVRPDRDVCLDLPPDHVTLGEGQSAACHFAGEKGSEDTDLVTS